MAKTKIAAGAAEHGHAAQATYTRFTLAQRIEHFLYLITFTTLSITGLAQMYSGSRLSEFLLAVMGGIEMTRVIHRVAAVLLIAESIYHVVVVLYKVFVLRVPWTMLPVIEDFKHLIQDVKYYIGLSKTRAQYGRYNYAEKAEYLAVVWGTIIMVLSGFMMWNPIATTNFLPGEFIPAAKAAHGGEALLAILAIILWHFYHVHLKHFNKSMFTGKLSEHEMLEEHPAELALIKAGKTFQPPAPEVVRRRLAWFSPPVALLTLAMVVGLYYFVTFEQTAITTLPRGENIPVFVPHTPTPTATAAPTATPAPATEAPLEESPAALTWDAAMGPMLNTKCGSCHGPAAMGGLSVVTYQDVLKGGNRGPAVIPGDPDGSVIIQIQVAGGHPGMLADAEIQQLVEWISAGAPEK